jgi:hypothetical protein
MKKRCAVIGGLFLAASLDNVGDFGSDGKRRDAGRTSTTASPLAGCTADDVAAQEGTNFPNSEVEPFLAVNPTNQANIVAVWQQDRWEGRAEAAGARGAMS